jgi:uncharacterized protein (UPF0333 family)
MRKAQSSLEFAIVIFAIVAALLAMQAYIRRGLQGRMRSSVDQLSVQQYEPGNTISDINITQRSNVDIITEINDADPTQYRTITTTNIHLQEENRTGVERILPRNNE